MLCAKLSATASKNHPLVAIHHGTFIHPGLLLQPASDGKRGFRNKKEDRRYIATKLLKMKDQLATRNYYHPSGHIQFKKGQVKKKAENYMKEKLGYYGVEYVDCGDEYEEW